MNVSHKCLYALRAIFELAGRVESTPVSVADIAEAQDIPVRFLEQILSQLKQGGFVTSRRGVQGGYTLAVSPKKLTVGEIINFLEGPLLPTPSKKTTTAGGGDYAFFDLWQRANDALASVYETTTFSDLQEAELAGDAQYIPNFTI